MTRLDLYVSSGYNSSCAQRCRFFSLRRTILQQMLDLLNNLDKGTPSKQKNEASSQLAQSSSRLAESEFSSTGVKNAGLTLDSLMGGIADTKGFGRVQKAFKDIASVPTADGKSDDGKKVLETTKAPVAKIVSERASRKVHYEEASGDVKRWTGVVKQNREAETLDFRPKDKMNIDREDLVGKFEATTDFEKEVADALEKAGAESEKDIARRERAELMGEDGADADIDADDDDAMAALDDDLGGNRISLEEYKKRHGELAKMRALMFYEEQKRHHINKIKSKKYRKIRKKQRERRSEAEKEANAEEDPDLVRELEEKEEMERMKERMSLRHKNTSKWAKQQLRRGKNIDTDTRRALSAQIQQGQDLRNKMNATMDRLNEDSSDEEGTSMLDQARAILADTEKDDDEADADKKGLFSLAFMKRGMEAQRARAKQEARQLLMELEANESDSSDGSGDEDSDDESDDGEKKKAKKPKTLSASETEKLLPKGKLVASALEFGNANTISVGGAIDVDLGDGSPPEAEAASDSDDSEDGETGTDRVTAHTATMKSSKSNVSVDVAAGDKKNPNQSAASKRSKRKAALVEEAKKDEAANPWVAAASQDDDADETDNKAGSKKKKRRKGEGVSKDGVVNVQGAHALLGGDDDSSEDENKMVLQKGGEKKKEGGVASLSQDELVRRAFATATEDDIDDEFEKEKEAMRERDDPTRKAKEETKVASGWGSWAGEGAPAPKPPRRLPKKLQPPEKKERRKRKDDKKKRVIINEKRVKRTAQFQLAEIPYPFTSREQYEKAMAGSIGAEWNVSGAVKDMTRPEVLTRAGKIIQPISKRAKAKRAPAKF